MTARFGKPDSTGRSSGKFTGRQKRLHSAPNGEPFVMLTRGLINSPALHALSTSAWRVLLFLLEEHLAHGGQENGLLKAPYRQLEQRGVHRHQIAKAIHLLEQVGIVAARRGGMRCPTTYRLTFLSTATDFPTNDWKAITIKSAPRKRGQKNQISAPRKGGQRTPSKGGQI